MDCRFGRSESPSLGSSIPQSDNALVPLVLPTASGMMVWRVDYVQRQMPINDGPLTTDNATLNPTRRLMPRRCKQKRGMLLPLGALMLVWTSLGIRTRAQSEEKGHTNLTVVVTDAQTNQPINQARLTLEFTEPGDPTKLKRSKKLSYSAKTNVQGHYKFPSLPKGTIRLIVTAERHQTFSKEFELEKENEAIEVKLKKPQPLL